MFDYQKVRQIFWQALPKKIGTAKQTLTAAKMGSPGCPQTHTIVQSIMFLRPVHFKWKLAR
jgi:hypothetical protein